MPATTLNLHEFEHVRVKRNKELTAGIISQGLDRVIDELDDA